MEEQNEMRQQFRQQQEKYIYYIIALSVAAIGFSVHKTTGLTLKWIQIPLGIAVISWGLSIFFGLYFLRYSISILYTNIKYTEILKGNDPMVGHDPQMVKLASETIMKLMHKNVNAASKFAKWQNILFFTGVILFIAWHIIEMFYA